MSFTQADYKQAFIFCRRVFAHSRDRDLKEEAKAVAVKIENVIGQQCSIPAEAWGKHN